MPLLGQGVTMGDMGATPAWLYYLFAATMLAIAGYCLALLVLGAVARRTAGWDVELAHLVMGLSMAGMFVGGWAFAPNQMWECLFAALVVWFVLRAGRSVLSYGLHLPHTAVHASMSFAMLLMYWFPMDMGLVSSHSAGIAGTAVSARPDPGLMLVLAVLFLASAVTTIASGHHGAAILGTHHAPTATRTVVLAGAGGHSQPLAVVLQVEDVLVRPRLLDGSHVAMCLAMAFMLVLMT
ncbi:MAG: DUF5134 domain-containing protein [Acidimicrobiales bacterium]